MPNSLTKLLASNKKRPERLPQSKIVAKDDETDIYIYDAIVADEDTAYWWGGVSAEALVPAIRAIKGGTIHLRINSPGGDVFAAQAICQAIRDTGAKVIAHVDGYAASAATVIATAADEVEISDGGFYMIHNAWTWAMGNANDLTATAALLSKIDGSLAAQYAKKSGMAVEDVRAAMDAETWYTAEEAVAAGLINRIAAGKKVEASWDLSAYNKAPKAPEPAAPADDLATEEHRARQLQRISMLSRLTVR
jgi:ATP-dependent Clp protease protease subunit